MSNQSVHGHFYNCEEIKTFRELMDNISYDWGFDSKNLFKDGNIFVINKTSIGSDYLAYKTECYPLAPGLYTKLEVFYNLLE